MATNHHWVKIAEMSTEIWVIFGRLVEPFGLGNCLNTLTKTGMTNVTRAISTIIATLSTTHG